VLAPGQGSRQDSSFSFPGDRALSFFVRMLPGPLVKVFARPYVAGASLKEALEVVDRILEKKLLSTMDLLWEDIHRQEEVDAVIKVYQQMIDACGERAAPTRPTVSLKPSSYTTSPLQRGQGMDAAGSREAILGFSEEAKRKDLGLTIDMEDFHWTEWTLRLLEEIWAGGGFHVGAVLQTRLNRTREDLARIPPEARVRLVIGIYNESKEIATTDKSEMKRRQLEYAGILLKKGCFVEFATHDEPVIHRFLEEVVPEAGVDASRFEIQMLYGVPREKIQQQLIKGKIGRVGSVAVRLYVPFATDWSLATAYCKRRLMENPQMATAVLKNLGRALFGQK
jgi:proline dehydrogenase